MFDKEGLDEHSNYDCLEGFLNQISKYDATKLFDKAVFCIAK